MAITLNLNVLGKVTEEKFEQICQANPDLKFERTAKGELMIMPPTGGGSGKRNANLTADFVIWNRQTQLGEVFDSSTGYYLPNSANRSPDVSWIKKERWEALGIEQQERFISIVPDFVLELMSPTDRLKEVQEKMQEYKANGVRLGWLIVPRIRRVEIYRQGQEVEVLTSPNTLSGEEILPGFVIDLSIIWD